MSRSWYKSDYNNKIHVDMGDKIKNLKKNTVKTLIVNPLSGWKAYG